MPMRNDYPVLLDRTQEEGAFSLRRDLQPAQVLVEGESFDFSCDQIPSSPI